MVPPSTREIVNTMLFGEYCMARSRCVRQHRLQLFEQFLPAGILMLFAGQGIEVPGFDLVHQL